MTALLLVCALLGDTGPALASPARGPARSLAADVQVYLDEVDLVIYRLKGRAPVGSAAVGLEFEHLDVDDGRFPDSLTDVSVALGGRFGERWGWQWGGTIGVGFAGDEPFGDSNAWYALGSLTATRPLSDRSALIVTLQFDGNRGFLPDWPLLGVLYRNVVSPELRYVLGIPFSSVYWKPAPRWEVEASGIPLLGGGVEVKFAATPEWKIFVRYRVERSYFHLDDTPARFRLRYEQQLVEFGVTWQGERTPAVTFAGGWGFEREFENESDSGREFGRVGLEDEAYLVIRLRLRF